MHRISSIVFFLIFGLTAQTQAQDTLPNISVKNSHGNIIISWHNVYEAVIANLNIQRSADSLKNYRTIGSILNPMNRNNGYTDRNPASVNMFYRVFIAFEDGSYLYSPIYRPVLDTSSAEASNLSVAAVLPTGFVPSRFIYTGKDDNVILNLPDAAHRKLSIKFFDEKDDFLFEIQKITEPYLILDKVNFLHSGWFHYQLMDNGVQVEKYKFFIPRDIKEPVK